jgi:hypothetical protein
MEEWQLLPSLAAEAAIKEKRGQADETTWPLG